MSQWRVAIGQKQYGPYSLEKLQQIYEEGRVPADAQIWHPEQENWFPADQVAELNPTADENDDDVVIMEEAPPRSNPVRPVHKHADGFEGTLMDYLTFRRMITPIIIQIIFWIGAVLSSLSGIGLMIAGLKMKEVGDMFLGFFVMILGAVLVRIYCELLIIFFRMNETLTEIRNDLKRSS